MTLAGGVAVLLSLIAIWAMAGGDRRVLSYYALLGGLHLAASGAFWVISMSGPADAVAYFRRSELSDDFGIGTQFILFLLHNLREWTGASFLDCFLFFQIPGLLGLMLLHKAARAMAEEGFGTRVLLLGLLLLLPGLHFWTASIGKDSLAMLAYGLLALGLARARFDWLMIGAGVLLYFLVRPHVGFVVLLAMVLAFLPIFGSSRPSAKLVGVGAGIVGAAILPLVIGFVGLEAAGIDEINAFVAERQGVNQAGSTSLDLAGQSPPMRVITFLYRPFFFDAPGPLGLIVSVENLALVVLTLILLANLRVLMRLLRLSEMLRFHAFFALIMTLMLSQTLANLGLAIRQKTMVLPAFILLLVAVVAVANRRQEDRLRDLAKQTGQSVPAE
ncbi:MAG: hypothetical protein AAGF44_05455 [Pseudomonadota bacterium]